MRDHAIVPTAQRLAEENNVDWRVLTGSGEGGSVVERDVLGYLARVMRGEEATDPTPEPLPEGLSAWPEEPERRRGAASQHKTNTATATRPEPRAESSGSQSPKGQEPDFSTPFSEPRSVKVTQSSPETEAYAPWTVDKPAKATLETPIAERAFPQADATTPKPAPETFANTAKTNTAKTGAPPVQPEPEATAPEVFTAEVFAPASVPTAPPKENVAEAYRLALAELETLQTRVAELEEERSRHVNELHQLSRMQETIALQKNEGAKVGALQSEVRDLKSQLAAAQRASERVETLAEHNRDLEARLVRARTFKSQAKAEFERLLEDHMMLEHELADLKKARRGLFRKG